MMKRHVFRTLLALAVAALIGAIGLPVQQVSAETYTISSLSGWPKTAFETSQFLKYLDLMQKEADQKYPGELKLVYKGGDEVIKNTEQVEACRTGLIDMVFTAGSYYTSVLPEIDTMSLTDMTPWEEKAAGVNAYLEKLHNEKVNVHMLARVGTGSKFHLFLAKPIKTVADLKGMKVRCSPTTVPFMKSVGATPIGMPPPDIYTAMERGVVDGYILPPATIRDFGLVKPSKYMIFPGFYQPVQFVLMNLDNWKKLPKHLQDMLDQGAEEMAHFAIKNIENQLQKELTDFKKEGMTFYEFPEGGRGRALRSCLEKGPRRKRNLAEDDYQIDRSKIEAIVTIGGEEKWPSCWISSVTSARCWPLFSSCSSLFPLPIPSSPGS
jgi:TRAP-type C4-dicarboxylate transport system substrate-binding protein